MENKEQCCNNSGDGLKCFAVITLIILSIVYCLVSALNFSDGLRDVDYSHTKCTTDWRRFDYVMPAYRFGCWMGTIPKKTECEINPDEPNSCI